MLEDVALLSLQLVLRRCFTAGRCYWLFNVQEQILQVIWSNAVRL